MAANDFVLAYQPNLTGMLAVKNTEASTTITAGMLCKLDTASPLSATQPFICVKQATASTDSPTFIAVDTMSAGKSGRVAVPGPVVMAVASAAVVMGVPLMGAAAGQVATQTAAKPLVGYALTPAANANDQILVLVSTAFNA